MEHILRFFEQGKPLLTQLRPGQVTALIGPRRSGKTTLAYRLLRNYTGKYLFSQAHDQHIHAILSSGDTCSIKSFFSGYDLVVIDEAQKILGAHATLKTVVETLPHLKVLLLRSCHFDQTESVSSRIAGRLQTETLYPLSILELSKSPNGSEVSQLLEQFLIYGMYPEVISYSTNSEKQDYLVSVVENHLLHDLLEVENLRAASKIHTILSHLAFNIGSDISLNELADITSLAKQTVERYLELLEKHCIIKKITGFSLHLPKEITNTSRYLFVDNGIRNAIVNNFNPLVRRNDQELLWKNFIFIERMKTISYTKEQITHYFWRTYDKKQLDCVEKRPAIFDGFNFTWNNKKTVIPKLWTLSYPSANGTVIGPHNWKQFLEL